MTTKPHNDGLKDLSEWAAKLPCMLNKAHTQRVKSYNGRNAVIECPDCKRELGITNELKVTITPKAKA